jgi:TatD DNase family protein
MRYFDAHAHIQFDPYDADREALLARMQEEEVGGLIVGVDLESSKRAIALVEGRDDLYASIGLHPNHEADEWFEAGNYAELARNPKVVAIGECGLDYYRPLDASDEVKRKQRNVLEDHIRLAVELDKPLMIHSRPSKGTMDAYQDIINILGSYKQEHGERLRGDIHFFVGGVDEARQLIELGFTISFTAVLTFARDYDEVVRYAPLSSILAETDAPYVAPVSRRGERNDPLSVRDVVRAVAEIRGEDEEAVREALLGNARRLFGL